MKTKVEFYKAFFEELEKKGFGVAQPSSPDYVVDIQFKGKTIAFYTKVDMIEKNPFVEVPEKQKYSSDNPSGRKSANPFGILKQ